MNTHRLLEPPPINEDLDTKNMNRPWQNGKAGAGPPWCVMIGHKEDLSFTEFRFN